MNVHASSKRFLDRGRLPFIAALIGFLLWSSSGRIEAALQDDDQLLQKEATWQWPELRSIEEQLKSHLDLIQATQLQRTQVEQAWSKLRDQKPGPMVLEQLWSLVKEVDPNLSKLLEPLTNGSSDTSSFDLANIQSQLPAWLHDNLKLTAAQLYCQSSQFDEAASLLESINEAGVVDPSSLMFYRAVCFHHLLDKEKCLEQIDRLLERESEVVSRYVVTAKLMKSDMQPFKPETLDEVARIMNDVERRLGLGRAGIKVREREQEIVDKLDKLIDKIEQQLQEQQQQQDGQSKDPAQQQGNPLNKSQIAGGQGPGDVNPKKLEGAGNWGDLPPAQRQEALQNITRDLPSHYREVIEAYFKRLGTGDR